MKKIRTTMRKRISRLEEECDQDRDDKTTRRSGHPPSRQVARGLVSFEDNKLEVSLAERAIRVAQIDQQFAID